MNDQRVRFSEAAGQRNFSKQEKPKTDGACEAFRTI
jgi:hypothetical protein